MPGQISDCPQLRKQTLSFSAWNVKDLVDRILGDKFENQDFIDHLNKFDSIVLSETWTNRSVDVLDYKCISSTEQKRNKGRLSGGVMILYKNQFSSKVVIQKRSKYYIWIQIDKSLLRKTKDLFLCRVYIPPETSIYFFKDLFEELESDIAEFSSKGFIMFLGDLNARTRKLNDYIIPDDNNFVGSVGLENYIIPKNRNNCNNFVNNYGKIFLDICKNHDLHILDGRIMGDSMGNFTDHSSQGVSSIDYIICDQVFFQQINYFIVKSATYLSDHCQIVAWLTLEGMGGGGGGDQSDPLDFFGFKFLFLDRLPKALAQLFFVG